MKRRDFIHINIAALGGVLINNHFSYAQAMVISICDGTKRL